MSKIIIKYDDSISDQEAMAYVNEVIRGGKVSTSGTGVKCYSWATVWRGLMTVCTREKRAESDPHSFVIYRESESTQ